MFVFHFKDFLGRLDIQSPDSFLGVPNNSPIYFFYRQPKEDLTKHEILKRFNNILRRHDINWIRPFQELTGIWVIDLKELKHSYGVLDGVDYLKGKLTIEPEYFVEQKFSEQTGETNFETVIKFSIYPEDIFHSNSYSLTASDELTRPLKRFSMDYPDSRKCGFLMMKFEDTPIQKGIIEVLKECFRKNDLFLLRADDKMYSDELLTNIKTYMHACSFGIALFERINSNYFNPNISLEIGYMMAHKKPILFLKDKTLESLHSDLVGKLYSEFDFQKIEDTLPQVIEKWILHNELV